MPSDYGHANGLAKYCHHFFGGKYDRIQLHRQIVHQNDRIQVTHEKFLEIFTTSIFYLKFKVNNNDCMWFLNCFLFQLTVDQNRPYWKQWFGEMFRSSHIFVFGNFVTLVAWFSLRCFPFVYQSQARRARRKF